MSEIVIIGGGTNAKVIISILNKIKDFIILGYTDIIDKGDILNVKYIGNDVELIKLKSTYSNCSAVIGIGIATLSDIDKRMAISEQLDALGFKQPAIISPSAIVNEDVKIGDGSVIFDGAIINTGSNIGNCVMINSNCSVDHDCMIGDHVFISPGATVCGGVVIGRKSFIGPGATITKYLNIAEGCIIGAGAVIVENCLKTGKYYGVPARWIE